jgi:hypothetical protein
VLEYGAFVALILLLTWAVLLVFLVRGQIKTAPFGTASLFLALMVPFFWLGSEITELTISQVGSFKTNVQQATQYLDEIRQIRDKLKAQEVALTSSVHDMDEKIAQTTEKIKAQETIIESQQARMSQRPWKKEQFDAIQEIKGVIKDVGIIWEPYCIECKLFAEDIETAFAAAGVQIYGLHQFDKFQATGIVVWLPEGSDPEKHPLMVALRKAGLDASALFHNHTWGLRTDIPVIFVGDRFPTFLSMPYMPPGGTTARILPVEE